MTEPYYQQVVEPWKLSCGCGAIEFTLNRTPTFSHTCYCNDCTATDIYLSSIKDEAPVKGKFKDATFKGAGYFKSYFIPGAVLDVKGVEYMKSIKKKGKEHVRIYCTQCYTPVVTLSAIPNYITFNMNLIPQHIHDVLKTKLLDNFSPEGGYKAEDWGWVADGAPSSKYPDRVVYKGQPAPVIFCTSAMLIGLAGCPLCPCCPCSECGTLCGNNLGKGPFFDKYKDKNAGVYEIPEIAPGQMEPLIK